MKFPIVCKRDCQLWYFILWYFIDILATVDTLLLLFTNSMLFAGPPFFSLAMFVSETRKEGENRRERGQRLIRKFFSRKFSWIMGIIHPRGRARLNPYETRWQTGIKRPKYSGAAVTHAGIKFWDFFRKTRASLFRITFLAALEIVRSSSSMRVSLDPTSLSFCLFHAVYIC